MVLMVFITNRPYSIQFNSKTSFKDGALLSLKPIFPGAIQTCKQMQQLFIHIYKTIQIHQTITAAKPNGNEVICL